MQLDCLYSENPPVSLSNSSVAPCCHLLDKAEKRLVTQRSHVFGWDDTPQTASQIMILYFFVGLLEHDAVYCSNTPPAYLQLFRCHGVECPCLSLQWERKINDTDREQKSIRDCFPIHPPHPDLGCCNSDSRRKEEGQFQLIGDQWWSVCGLIRDQEQWVGPAPPLSYTNPDVPRPPILAQIRAAGPANRGGPPWLSTVRGWCNSGTDADRLREQKEEGWLGQSRHGPWSLEDGPERILEQENSLCRILLGAQQTFVFTVRTHGSDGLKMTSGWTDRDKSDTLNTESVPKMILITKWRASHKGDREAVQNINPSPQNSKTLMCWI